MILVGHGNISYEPVNLEDYFSGLSEEFPSLKLERIIHVDELGGNEGEEFQLLIIPGVPSKIVKHVKRLISDDIKHAEVFTRALINESEDSESDQPDLWMIFVAIFNEY